MTTGAFTVLFRVGVDQGAVGISGTRLSCPALRSTISRIDWQLGQAKRIIVALLGIQVKPILSQKTRLPQDLRPKLEGGKEKAATGISRLPSLGLVGVLANNTTPTGKLLLVGVLERSEKKGSGTVMRSTLRAVAATVPDPFFPNAI